MTINKFDNGLTRVVQGWPKWWSPIMIAASFMCDPLTLAVLIVGSIIVAAQTAPAWTAEALAWSVPAMIVNGVIKQYLHRPRPDTLYVSKMPFHTFSFPSGHSFCAMVFYGLFAYGALVFLAAPLGLLLAVALAVLIALIGISRVYLGAHFPTDVIGGWVFGFIALAVIILAVAP